MHYPADLLGRMKIGNVVRYPDIEVEDARTLAGGAEIRQIRFLVAASSPRVARLSVKRHEPADTCNVRKGLPGRVVELFLEVEVALVELDDDRGIADAEQFAEPLDAVHHHRRPSVVAGRGDQAEREAGGQ